MLLAKSTAGLRGRPQLSLEVRDLIATMSRESRLDRTQVPDYIQVVDELPKTATEKVQTRLLAQAFDPSAHYVFSREKLTA